MINVANPMMNHPKWLTRDRLCVCPCQRGSCMFLDLSHYWRYSQDGAWAKSLDPRCAHSWVLSVGNWGLWNLILAVPMHSMGRTGSHLKRSNFLITDPGFRHRWRRIRWHLEFSESQMQQKTTTKKIDKYNLLNILVHYTFLCATIC